MARNRKRRSDRRPHRPANGPLSEPGVATARAARPPNPDDPPREDPPDPLEHSAPDVELAEAQLALGRPAAAEPVPEEELVEEAVDDGGSTGGRRGRRRDGGGELAPATAAHPAPWVGARLIHFLQGSWRELQRVQWPDRRQVIQATGVVIGFVIVAGVFLGVADVVAKQVVHFILK